jgi:hypothetical protein
MTHCTLAPAPEQNIARGSDHMEIPSNETSSARFFDDLKQDRGWAKKVTKRPKGIGRLTVLDVVTSDSQLASFLEGLDHSGLRVQCTDLGGESYEFAWASGYANGSGIRIRGLLVGA